MVLGWEAFRKDTTLSADDYRQQSISTHGVFLNALGLAGRKLIAQYGAQRLKEVMTPLKDLDTSRMSELFVGRCIDPVTGNMKSDSTAIKLTANKILDFLGCPLNPTDNQLERQYFPETCQPDNEPEDREAPHTGEGEGEAFQHEYAQLVKERWPETNEEDLKQFCHLLDNVVTGLGLSKDEARMTVSITVNNMKKRVSTLKALKSNVAKQLAA